MACSSCNNSTPPPCCQDCPETNPCTNGCLDFVDATCVEYTSELPDFLSITSGSKLDYIIRQIDQEIGALQSGGDKFVRITGMDPVSGYLSDKVQTCDYLTKEIVTSGGQQKLKLCIDTVRIVSTDDTNPIEFGLDGLIINYTTLVETIVSDPALVQLLCNALDGCVPE